ncbi:MAG: hypothetical protein NVSMB27_41280 [Ktedonobacteraceae bacterium]
MKRKSQRTSLEVATPANDLTEQQAMVEQVNAYLAQESVQVNRQATRSEISGSPPSPRTFWRRIAPSRLRLHTIMLSLLLLLLMLAGVERIGPHRSAHASSMVSVNTPLTVPYLRQYQGQSTQNYDCGPASVAMVLEYYNVQPTNSSNSNLMTQVRNSTDNTSGGDTGFTDLERALSHYGLSYNEISNSLSPQPGAQMQAMQQAITAYGEPVIALIHGADLGRGSRYSDHWVVVTGFSSDGQAVYLNDPDNQPMRWSGWIQGGQIAVPLSTFQQAARDAAPGPYGIIVSKNNAPVTPQPPSSSDLNYITSLYRDVLNREPSPSEVNGWAQQLAQGQSRAAVAYGFLDSAEYRANLVATDYSIILNRDVDQPGAATYLGVLNNGGTNEDVLVDLAASDEFYNGPGGGTNSGFVDALYQAILQRASDPSGAAYYTQELDNATASQAEVARSLLTSTEYRTLLVDNYYQQYLRRAADPGGESNYVSALTQGKTDEDAIASLVTSDEYYALSQSS